MLPTQNEGVLHFGVGTLSPPPMSAPHNPSTPSEVLSNNRFSFFKTIPKSQKLTRNQLKGVVDTCTDWMRFNCHIFPQGNFKSFLKTHLFY